MPYEPQRYTPINASATPHASTKFCLPQSSGKVVICSDLSPYMFTPTDNPYSTAVGEAAVTCYDSVNNTFDWASYVLDGIILSAGQDADNIYTCGLDGGRSDNRYVTVLDRTDGSFVGEHAAGGKYDRDGMLPTSDFVYISDDNSSYISLLDGATVSWTKTRPGSISDYGYPHDLYYDTLYWRSGGQVGSIENIASGSWTEGTTRWAFPLQMAGSYVGSMFYDIYGHCWWAANNWSASTPLRIGKYDPLVNHIWDVEYTAGGTPLHWYPDRNGGLYVTIQRDDGTTDSCAGDSSGLTTPVEIVHFTGGVATKLQNTHPRHYVLCPLPESTQILTLESSALIQPPMYLG